MAELGRSVELDAQDALHISKVLRMKPGSSVQITNGRGELFQGILVVSAKSQAIEIQSLLSSGAPKHHLEMIVAPTKNQDRLEWFIEKAVEIGVGKIQLITADHSERSHIRHDRLERIAISAMKQSLKLHLPEILEPVSFNQWLSVTGDNTFIAHCRDTPPKRLLRDVLVKGNEAKIAIGPEGDFSVAELQKAVEAGCMPVSLGESRLRTETAALCAVHTFELINQ